MPIGDNPSLMREIIEEMDYMVRVMDSNHNVIYMNKKMAEKYGHTFGHICYSLLGREEKCDFCITKETLETGKPRMKKVLVGDRYYNTFSSPVDMNNGENYSIEIFSDITEQHKTEEELMKHYEKLKADIEFAKQVQTRALPVDGKYWDSIEINSLYDPSEDLGGDLYDVIKTNENESLIYIADVSGHGITSSLMTIFIRQMIRGRVRESKVDLKSLLGNIQKSHNELGMEPEQYMTILFCLYNKEAGEVRFLNAGHNCMPVIIKKSGEVKEIEVKGMPVCRLKKKTAYKEAVAPVEAGDRIILYTDGITEACNENREMFGTERLLRTIRENHELDGKTLARKVIDEAELFSGNLVADDMAIVVAKIL